MVLHGSIRLSTPLVTPLFTTMVQLPIFFKQFWICSVFLILPQTCSTISAYIVFHISSSSLISKLTSTLPMNFRFLLLIWALHWYTPPNRQWHSKCPFVSYKICNYKRFWHCVKRQMCQFGKFCCLPICLGLSDS